MRIECPSCSAEYEVPAARIGARRLVRCSRCNVEWTAEHEPEPPSPILMDDPPDEHDTLAPVADAMHRLAAPASPQPRRWGLTAAWAASVLVLVGFAAACVVWRADVVAFWPPSERLLGTAEHRAPHDAAPAAKEKAAHPAGAKAG